MSASEPTSLRARLDEILGTLLAESGGLSPGLEGARARLHDDVTFVVTGRRGRGKTTVISTLLGEPVGRARYTAEDRPVQLLGALRNGAIQPWVEWTSLPPASALGRRFVELPEHLSAEGSDGVRRVQSLGPDALVHVARRRLHSDEAELIARAGREWRLQRADMTVVGAEEEGPWMAARRDELVGRVEAVGRLVVARRCAEVMQQLGALAARPDACGWGAQVIDDLEHLSLSPQGHVVRERWALDTSLARPADVPVELRDELVRLTLGPSRQLEEPTALLSRAGHWRALLPLLPPLAAEVARVVVRTLQLHAHTHEASSTEGERR